MSEQIIEFIDAAGHPVVVNLRHVIFGAQALMQGQNGGGPNQIAIGLSALKMVDGQLLIVRCAPKDLYRRLKGQLSIFDGEQLDK